MLKEKAGSVVIIGIAVVVMLGTAAMSQQAAQPAQAKEAKAGQPVKYAKMAPVEEYLMERTAEIALARTAAPESISREADVMVVGRKGYETAVKGKNGFVCIVGRGWAAAADPDYWNPKVRVPMCVNAAGARTYLLRVRKITELALAGRTLEEVNEAMGAAVAKKELPPMEAGAMCYMMGKEGYGGDVAPHWPAHLMFFYTDTDPAIWGANEAGSPILAIADPLEHLTQFVIPTQRWSDGTEAGEAKHHHGSAK